MSCTYETYKERKNKREVFEHYDYIKNKKCCSDETCDKLSQELEELQHNCDDAFRDMHQGEVDEKGLTQGTLCEDIKKAKNNIIDKSMGTARRSLRGGKKTKRKSKRLRKRKSIKR
jgi:hypothetical protein